MYVRSGLLPPAPVTTLTAEYELAMRCTPPKEKETRPLVALSRASHVAWAEATASTKERSIAPARRALLGKSSDYCVDLLRALKFTS
jgi:hypothetical protein